MRKQKIPHTDLEVSRLIYGCMLIGGDWEKKNPVDQEQILKARSIVDAALENGINFFDHADIYCSGKAETAFGALLRDGLKRDQLIIQTKCGIRFGGDPTADAPHRYDFSREHIVRSVEGSLKRLETDYVDILLLHRPDPLAEPEEIAKAFDALQEAGKVRHFGVSNHTPAQMALLQKHVRQPLVANQIQASILHSQPFDSGIVSGYGEEGAALRGDGTLDYCRLHDIAVQAYSPLARGKLGEPAADDAEPRLKTAIDVLNQLAPKYEVEPEALAVAFLLRHPAKIQPIIGTRSPERLKVLCAADRIELGHSDWHRLHQAGRGCKLP